MLVKQETSAREVDRASTELVELIGLASEAMGRATEAVFAPDASLGAGLNSAYRAVDALRREVDSHATETLAVRRRSAEPMLVPATIAAVHINAEAEVIGQLAREVADIARTRRCWPSVPETVREALREVSGICLVMMGKAADVVESRGAAGIAELAACDASADRAQRVLYRRLLSRDCPIDADAAVDLTLVARCYERFAWHAMAVGRRALLLDVDTATT
ncbi:phosphate signaling complex PhoU family protein [Amycolatopsis sp. NPDC051903]|uniref:phosphate signaling complex PhoU family protein n=1 Tax=Amycolatopsis sp. NPDC051903 TaxID=3363936 RepID=UPI003787D7D1